MKNARGMKKKTKRNHKNIIERKVRLASLVYVFAVEGYVIRLEFHNKFTSTFSHTHSHTYTVYFKLSFYVNIILYSFSNSILNLNATRKWHLIPANKIKTNTLHTKRKINKIKKHRKVKVGTIGYTIRYILYIWRNLKIFFCLCWFCLLFSLFSGINLFMPNICYMFCWICFLKKFKEKQKMV